MASDAMPEIPIKKFAQQSHPTHLLGWAFRNGSVDFPTTICPLHDTFHCALWTPAGSQQPK